MGVPVTTLSALTALCFFAGFLESSIACLLPFHLLSTCKSDRLGDYILLFGTVEVVGCLSYRLGRLLIGHLQATIGWRVALPLSSWGILCMYLYLLRFEGSAHPVAMVQVISAQDEIIAVVAICASFASPRPVIERYISAEPRGQGDVSGINALHDIVSVSGCGAFMAPLTLLGLHTGVSLSDGLLLITTACGLSLSALVAFWTYIARRPSKGLLRRSRSELVDIPDIAGSIELGVASTELSMQSVGSGKLGRVPSSSGRESRGLSGYFLPPASCLNRRVLVSACHCLWPLHGFIVLLSKAWGHGELDLAGYQLMVAVSSAMDILLIDWFAQSPVQSKQRQLALQRSCSIQEVAARHRKQTNPWVAFKSHLPSSPWEWGAMCLAHGLMFLLLVSRHSIGIPAPLLLLVPNLLCKHRAVLLQLRKAAAPHRHRNQKCHGQFGDAVDNAFHVVLRYVFFWLWLPFKVQFLVASALCGCGVFWALSTMLAGRGAAQVMQCSNDATVTTDPDAVSVTDSRPLLDTSCQTVDFLDDESSQCRQHSIRTILEGDAESDRSDAEGEGGQSDEEEDGPNVPHLAFQMVHTLTS